MRRTCLVAALSTVLMVPLIIKAQAPQSAAGDIELQLGDLLAAEGRFREAIVPYRRAVAAAADDEGIKRQARTGLTFGVAAGGGFCARRGRKHSSSWTTIAVAPARRPFLQTRCGPPGSSMKPKPRPMVHSSRTKAKRVRITAARAC